MGEQISTGAVRTLTAHERDARIMRYFGARTLPEAGAVLEAPRGSVAWRLLTGMLVLRDDERPCRQA